MLAPVHTNAAELDRISKYVTWLVSPTVLMRRDASTSHVAFSESMSSFVHEIPSVNNLLIVSVVLRFVHGVLFLGMSGQCLHTRISRGEFRQHSAGTLTH